MSATQSEIQQIPQGTKDLVYGYIRTEIETILNDYSIIADDIKLICLLFCNPNKDIFVRDSAHPSIEIHENIVTVTTTGQDNSDVFVAYFVNKVSKGRHIWKFKCL